MGSRIQIVDLDDILWNWASSKLGDQYVVEKVDTSKLDIKQMSVLYHSSGVANWWATHKMREEYFDNNEKLPSSWHFAEKVSFDSRIVWSLSRAFKSSKLLPTRFRLEFPVAKDGEEPYSVTFDSDSVQQTRKIEEGKAEFDVSTYVTVQPYSSAHACVLLRTCKLRNVSFTTDIQMSGSLKITGHKKSKKLNKHEINVNIVDALANKESLGFWIYDSPKESSGSTKYAAFRMEGSCCGEVAVDTEVKVAVMESAV